MGKCSIFAVLVVICAVNAAEDNRIVGGMPESIIYHPYQVSILDENNSLICGGSIIGPNFVLTGAGCLVENIKRYIRAGSSKATIGGTLHEIAQHVIHSKYVNNKYDTTNDIGLVMVKQRFIYSPEIKPIMLMQQGINLDNKIVEISGFGSISETGPLSEFLKSVKLPVVNRRKCDAAYLELGMHEITENRFCAGVKEGGKDACKGDAGGAVTYGGLQVGIVSYGNGCGRPKYPGIHTNVTYYMDWIFTNVGLMTLNSN